MKTITSIQLVPNSKCNKCGTTLNIREVYNSGVNGTCDTCFISNYDRNQ